MFTEIVRKRNGRTGAVAVSGGGKKKKNMESATSEQVRKAVNVQEGEFKRGKTGDI